MFVEKCPKCGRNPKITECVRFKNGIRRKLCGCPNYCSVITRKNRLYTPWFEFDGEGDDNSIFKVWNEAISLYKENEPKDWFHREYKNFNSRKE